MKYDYLLVGSGLFNAVFAFEATRKGKKCLVVERRNHIGGNCYTEDIDGVTVHRYGAHVFRTSDKRIWDFINQFAIFNNFVNSPMANSSVCGGGGVVYNLPFNMNTFSKLWNISRPEEAKRIIGEQSKAAHRPARNLEDYAIGLVGVDIYEKLIKGYTEKQWGRSCRELPVSIMKRIPMRFTYDNNYYKERYQGVPETGYTGIMEKLFSGCDMELCTDYLSDRTKWEGVARKTIFTGTIDSYFDYSLGALEYRSLVFETETMDCENYQGVAVMNYTSKDVPYTRVIEHKHFVFGEQGRTVVTKEYPIPWSVDREPYYPINDEKNNQLYQEYQSMADQCRHIVFAGRLGNYRYNDMQETVREALKLAAYIV